MPSLTQHLLQQSLLPQAPDFLSTSVHYEVIMGSVAYGVSEDQSDIDVYGFIIPPAAISFPHKNDFLPLFDNPPKLFEQYQMQHIWDQSARNGQGCEYDLTLYHINKYFRLLLDNNPNIIDSLFVPESCILYASPIALQIRSQRQLFLHKGCWAKFRGYAYGQLHQLKTKQPSGKRRLVVEQFGYDVKFAYHIVRLLHEVEQLLTEAHVELDRHKTLLKTIRQGGWTLPELEQYVQDKVHTLDQLHPNSILPDTPNHQAVRALLVDCLTHAEGVHT